MDSEIYSLEQSDTGSAQQTLQTVLRFLRLVLRHRLIVLGFVAVAVFIAVVQFKRTPKTYMASASMMIRHMYTSGDKDALRATQHLMNSYKQLLLSDEVLTAVAASLKNRVPPELQKVSPAAVPGRLRSMLEVAFDPKQNHVEVSCRSRDPESTVHVIEALTVASESFITADSKNHASTRIAQYERESKLVTADLGVKRKELLDARTECGDTSTLNGSEESHPIVQRVAELSRQITSTSTRLVALESTWQTIQTLKENNQDLAQIIPAIEKLVGKEVIDQIPGVHGVSPGTTSELEDSLHKINSEILERSNYYGRKHPEISQRLIRQSALQRRLNVAHQTNRNRLAGRIRDPQVAQWMLNTVSAEYNIRSGHRTGLEVEYRDAAEAALTLNAKLAGVEMVENEVQTLQDRLSTLQTLLKTIEIGESDPTIRVAHLTDAQVPGAPVAPVLSRGLAMNITLGLFAAFVLIYVIDLIDDRLRSPEDVQSQLGLQVLGVMRPLPDDEMEDHRIYVHGHPLSVQTECFRTIRTSITLSEAETRCLAITSSEEGEGKTTLTSNLAATFAQTGSRTLLIDADMRRPGLSKLLDIRGQGGLSEILRANDNVPQMCEERTVETEVPGLHVLPCGPRMMNAGVLLSMPSLAVVLDWAVSKYDQVLVDCPPTLPVSDASIVGNYVDGMLFLLNPENTHRRSALRAVDQLRSVGLSMVGVITNTSSEAHAGSYGYGYGYGQEYTYGHDEQDEEALEDVVAGATFERSEKNQRPYSLLSGSDPEQSNSGTTEDPNREAA